MGEIKIKKLHEGCIIPKKAHPDDAAYDVAIPEDVIIRQGRNVVPLGFAMELPKALFAEIHSRSGFAAKGMEGYEVRTETVTVINSITEASLQFEDFVAVNPSRFNADVKFGCIDNNYRGNVSVIIKSDDKPFMLKAGTRIAQMILRPMVMFSRDSIDFEVVDELSATERGDGGFGHTGA